MKPFPPLDPYDVLEIPRGASPEDVERAYRLALETFMDDSLAGYSVFGDGDVRALRERAHSAYRMLADPEARQAYDASLGRPAEPLPPAAPAPEPAAVDEAIDDLDEDGPEWTGARLRRVRLRRGLELDDIASITKINPAYLRFIEEDRFEALPARVYVRGFVAALARCLHLDTERVTTSYLKRAGDRPGAQRGRRP